MSVGYRVFPEHHFVFIKFSALASARQTIAAHQRYQSDPAYNPDADFLADLESVTSYDIDYRGMLALVQALLPEFRSRKPGFRTAIHAPADPGFGVARMYQTILQAHAATPVAVFRSWPPTLHFLSLDPALLPALKL